MMWLFLGVSTRVAVPFGCKGMQVRLYLWAEGDDRRRDSRAVAIRREVITKHTQVPACCLKTNKVFLFAYSCASLCWDIKTCSLRQNALFQVNCYVRTPKKVFALPGLERQRAVVQAKLFGHISFSLCYYMLFNSELAHFHVIYKFDTQGV